MGSAVRVLRHLAAAIFSPSLGLRSTALASVTEDLVSVGLATAAPLLLKDIVDRLTCKGEAPAALGLELTAFVLAWASPNVGAVLKLAHTNRTIERLHIALTTAILHRQLESRSAAFDGAAVSALLERTPAALQLVFEGLLWRAAPLALQTLATLWALSLALPFNAVAILALTALGFLAAAGLGARPYQARLAHLHGATLLASTELADLAQHADRAVINGTVAGEVIRLQQFNEARAISSNKVAASLVGMVALQFAILSVGLGLLLILAARDVLAHRLSVGAFVMAQAFALRLILPLGGLMVSLRQAGPALETLGALFALSGPIPYTPKAPRAFRSSGVGLVVEALSYRHPDGAPGVEGVSFSVRPGELIAIVGANGAGKSTLARLLAGQLAPQSGRVTVAGVDLASVAVQSLPDLVLYAPQGFTLFNRTLLETGCYPPSEASGEALEQRLDDLAFTAPAQPMAFDALVGRNGDRLSGGQRQKLELARLAGAPTPVLILDEITSALDASADQQAIAALRAARPDALIVLVTHRRHHATMADRVIHLRRGQLIGLASDADLSARDPSYRRLWERSDDPREG